MRPTPARLLIALLLLACAANPAAGCTDFAAAPSSRWRTVSDGGVAWLVTPCGDRFFSVGVNIVDGGAPRRDGPDGYLWKNVATTFRGWARATREQLRAWGFNTAGAWSLSPSLLDLPSTIDLSLGRSVSFMWPDPFHPELPARVNALARRLVAPYRDDPRRIGYFSDNEIGWWNGPLFVAYTRYAADSYTKRRLVRMLRERYAGDWDAFVRDFVPPSHVRSFEDLLRETRATTTLRPGGGGFAAIREWTGLVASLYYRVMREAIHRADPDALYLGDRLPIYYDPDAVRAMAPHVDVVSTNYNVDGPDGWIARYYFEGLRGLTARPVLVTEWFFAAHENRTGNRNRTGLPRTRGRLDVDPSNNVNRTGHLMTVGTQQERAAGAAAAAEAMAREPNVVGLHWFQLYDHPKGGRADGEDYNFGLVDVRGRPYDALVAALAGVNARAAALHAQRPLEGPPTAALPIPHAAVDARDNALTDWPRPAALVPLHAAPGEVLFGDLYLSWDAHGLNVAVIAMDYHDDGLMVWNGASPAADAFRVDVAVRRGDDAGRVRLLVVPDGPTGFRVEGCRPEAGRCTPLPLVGSFFGVAKDQPRIVFEAKLPWAALGGRPAAGAGLELRAEVVSFYRARRMSLAAPPGSEAEADWRQAVLTPP